MVVIQFLMFFGVPFDIQKAVVIKTKYKMEKSTRNLLIAGVSGLAVGATLGVLFAPAEGKKTRAKLKERANDLADSFSKKAENPQDLFAEIKHKLDTSLTNGKSELKDELIEQIEELEASLKKA